MLASYTELVDAALDSFLEGYTDPSELYEPVRYITRNGGKRVRPQLVMLACKAVGGNAQTSINAAAATELLHAFTLVHDDIMDSSMMRRGKPTVHVTWNVNTGILAGDVMIGLALRLLEMDAEPSKNAFRILQTATSGIIDVCEGQALDLNNTGKQSITLDEYFTTIEKKTARLLEMCVQIGGLIGDADNQQLTALRSFARKLGLAFQMQDDLLDLLGSASFGKVQGGDLMEGKLTWFVLRLRESEQCHELVDRFFANNGIETADVQAMVDCMQRSGIIDEGRSLIATFTNEAFAHLQSLPDNEGRKELEMLADQLLNREK